MNLVAQSQELSPGQVRRTLESVLSRSEFADRATPPVLEWIASIRSAIGEFFQRLLRELLGFLSGLVELSGASAIVTGALVFGATIILARILYVTWIGIRTRSHQGGETSVGADTLPSGAELLGEWEARARDALAEGRLLDAAHALYAALVLRLEAGGVVEVEESKTPGDYRREARRRDPEAGRLLDRFIRRFEPFVFGGRAPEKGPLVEMTELARGGGVRV